MKLFNVLALAFLIFSGTSAASFADRRVALVIGNGDYISMPGLSNPVNDATDVSEKLTSLGFVVISGFDLDRREMEGKIREFFAQISGSDVALFYYAGHGLQVAGQNYMAPVGASLRSQDDLPFETIPLDLILSTMEREGKSNLVFLDACRDNPVVNVMSATRSASAGRGLARVESGVGMMISYSTSPGQVASDGVGRNSPYTEALLKHLGEPGVDIALTMRKVRRDVLTATNDKQLPWEVASLTGDLVLGSKDGFVVPSDEKATAKIHRVKTSTIPADMPPSPAPVEAQSVFLYEEKYGGSAPAAVRGNVIWSVQEESSEGDAKPEPIIQAQIEVPERGLTAVMKIRRNTDPSLPASHILEFIFSPSAQFPGGGIANIVRVSMKQSEQERGDPLVGIPAKITDEFHMLALNGFTDAVTKNTTLLRDRSWIDIPMTYQNGRRSLLTLEKGAAAMDMFSRVIENWNSTLTAEGD